MDLTVDDVKSLVFELYMVQRENDALRKENESLKAEHVVTAEDEHHGHSHE